MALEHVYQRNESLVTRDLAGEKVIIPVRGKVGDLGNIYTLNGVGKDVWELMDGKRDVAAILGALGDEYEVDFDTLSSDVQALLADMRQEGLILEVSGGRE